MSKKVEFHFDFGSPNAYLAHKVVPEIEARTGVKFRYVPVLLGGIFKQGVVLICHADEHSVHGVLLTSPSTHRPCTPPDPNGPEVQARRALARLHPGVAAEWRRGGPVCGGRLGGCDDVNIKEIRKWDRGCLGATFAAFVAMHLDILRRVRAFTSA